MKKGSQTMNKLIKSSIQVVTICVIFLVSGCAVYPAQYHDGGYGPPPHAPANGYRYKYQGHDFVYDANLGVYLVVGYADYYFLDNYYYRYRNNGWYSSRYFDRDWKQYKKDKLPPGLVRKYRDQGRNDHNRGRDHDDDRGRDRGDSGYDRH